MNRRAMTLLELLLAIALLSGLVLAGVAWTSSVARASVGEQERTNWFAAADAVLQLIRDDVACGDLNLRDAGRDAESTWIRADDDGLRVQVRGEPFNGDELAVYAIETVSGALTRRFESDGRATESRLLLANLDAFEISIRDQEPESKRQRLLDVTLRARSGDAVTGVFALRDRSEP